MPKMIVTASGLNLRSTPETDPENIILVLPRGQEVKTLDESEGQTFRQVETIIRGRRFTGFAGARFLREEMSAPRERLIQGALSEWNIFNQGAGKETVEPYTSRIGEYWRALDSRSTLDGDDTDAYWSAAFISFIARNAGYNDFIFSDAHSRYIRDAKSKRNSGDANAPFWLFRIGEHKPKVGDMVCQWRDSVRTFEDLPGRFPSHCDVIVEINEGIAKAIGGNVSQSVSRTDFSLNDRGFLRPQRAVFAVMRNNR